METSSQLEAGVGAPELEALPRTGGTHEPFPLRVLERVAQDPLSHVHSHFTGAGLGWAASASLWSESDFTGLEFNRIFVVFFFFFFL